MKLNTKALLLTATALLGFTVLSFRADLLPGIGLHLAGNPDGPRSLLEPQGLVAQAHYNNYLPAFWGAVLLFCILGGPLVYSLFTRQKNTANSGGDKRIKSPAQRMNKAWAGLFLFYLLLFLSPRFLPSASKGSQKLDVSNPDTIEINVTGHQWWYSFHYPSHGVVTSNEFVFPTHTPVKINLLSKDSIHSFWMPKLTGKGHLQTRGTNHLWIHTENEGNYSGQCTEYCGDSHAYMLFRGIATSKAKFEKWIQNQKQPAKLNGLQGQSLLGYELFTGKQLYSLSKEKGMDENPVNCTDCHALGTKPSFPHAPYRTSPYPNLTNFAGRTTLAASWRNLDKDNLKEWIQQPGKVKPGNRMWLKLSQAYGMADNISSPGLFNRKESKAIRHAKFFTDEEAEALATFLLTLKSPDAINWGEPPLERQERPGWIKASALTNPPSRKVASNQRTY